MPQPRHYGDPADYERKLSRVMERFAVGRFNFNYDRHGAFVEFWRRDQYYRLEQTVERSQKSKSDARLHYGSDCFCQIVLALEDLARLSERGIYDLQVWIEGLRALPAGGTVPGYFLALGLDRVPESLDAVHQAYRSTAKRTHPDAGGTPEAFRAVQEAYARARGHFGQAGDGECSS